MAGFFEVKNARRLILIFAAISALLISTSVGSLLYRNDSIHRLSDSIYSNVYGNSRFILNADRNLHQAALAIQGAMQPNLSNTQKKQLVQKFEEHSTQAQEQVTQTLTNIHSLAISEVPGQGKKAGQKLLAELKNELSEFNSALDTWQTAAKYQLTEQASNGQSPSVSVDSALTAQVNSLHGMLVEADDLMIRYGLEVKNSFRDRESFLFAIYAVLLSLLILLILHLGRKFLSLQKDMLEEQTMYQLIGETMSDCVILTDLNGFILYASPSHASVLGYVPEKGKPLSVYIREPEISWAKLKSVVQGLPRLTELRIRSAEGRWVWLETKVCPVKGSRKLPAQFMLVSREITHRKKHEERLHKLAFYDHLTSIPNRAHFKMYMENLISRPDSEQTNIALALLDCDRFKQLNDTLGHLAGDEFLQLLSRELQQAVQGSGQAFRMGGDEFAIVLHSFDQGILLEDILNRLLQLFNKTWTIADGCGFQTSASIGVALYPKHGRSINELLRAADLAMYRSKNSGGNEASLYDELLDEEYSQQSNG